MRHLSSRSERLSVRFPRIVRLRKDRVLGRTVFNPTVYGGGHLRQGCVIDGLYCFDFVNRVRTGQVGFLPEVNDLGFERRRVSLFLVEVVVRMREPPQAYRIPYSKNSSIAKNSNRRDDLRHYITPF